MLLTTETESLDQSQKKKESPRVCAVTAVAGSVCGIHSLIYRSARSIDELRKLISVNQIPPQTNLLHSRETVLNLCFTTLKMSHTKNHLIDSATASFHS